MSHRKRLKGICDAAAAGVLRFLSLEIPTPFPEDPSKVLASSSIAPSWSLYADMDGGAGILGSKKALQSPASGAPDKEALAGITAGLPR